MADRGVAEREGGSGRHAVHVECLVSSAWAPLGYVAGPPCSASQSHDLPHPDDLFASPCCIQGHLDERDFDRAPLPLGCIGAPFEVWCSNGGARCLGLVSGCMYDVPPGHASGAAGRRSLLCRLQAEQAVAAQVQLWQVVPRLSSLLPCPTTMVPPLHACRGGAAAALAAARSGLAVAQPPAAGARRAGAGGQAAPVPGICPGQPLPQQRARAGLAAPAAVSAAGGRRLAARLCIRRGAQ